MTHVLHEWSTRMKGGSNGANVAVGPCSETPSTDREQSKLVQWRFMSCVLAVFESSRKSTCGAVLGRYFYTKFNMTKPHAFQCSLLRTPTGDLEDPLKMVRSLDPFGFAVNFRSTPVIWHENLAFWNAKYHS